MALDHYVSQVHLKNFHAKALGERLFAIRKSDLKSFPCCSRDVCRTEDGSTNDFLVEPRVVEDFLKTIEPKYNASVNKLRRDEIDHEAIYVLAGFVAYVATCSPAAMRTNSEPLRGMVEAESLILDNQGLLPKAPGILDGKSLSELIADGAINIAIDGKYPQAIGIGNILRHVSNFGNFDWEVLLNQHSNSPFFTSDYPIAIEETENVLVTNRIIPLAPDLAIRIKPDLQREKVDDLAFPHFQSRIRKISLAEVRKINRLIVRTAESLVFSSETDDWVPKFVERNRRYQLEAVVRRMPAARGHMVWSRLELKERV